jgi:hypothetical protein
VKIDNFFAQRKRRNLYKVAVAYAVVGWLLVQIATQVFPFLDSELGGTVGAFRVNCNQL